MPDITNSPSNEDINEWIDFLSDAWLILNWVIEHPNSDFAQWVIRTRHDHINKFGCLPWQRPEHIFQTLKDINPE
jgi:hypothetical protein